MFLPPSFRPVTETGPSDRMKSGYFDFGMFWASVLSFQHFPVGVVAGWGHSPLRLAVQLNIVTPYYYHPNQEMVVLLDDSFHPREHGTDRVPLGPGKCPHPSNHHHHHHTVVTMVTTAIGAADKLKGSRKQEMRSMASSKEKKKILRGVTRGPTEDSL